MGKKHLFYVLAQRDGGYTCRYCKRPLAPNAQGDTAGECTVDHFVPLALGGRNTLDNKVLCCIQCNFAKGDKSPYTWCAEQGLRLWDVKPPMTSDEIGKILWAGWPRSGKSKGVKQ